MKWVPCICLIAFAAPRAASSRSSASFGTFLHDHENGVDTTRTHTHTAHCYFVCVKQARSGRSTHASGRSSGGRHTP